MKSIQWSEESKWIWLQNYDDTTPDGKIALFRKRFNLAAKPERTCMLNVSADTRYRLFVNGQSVSFGPCKSFVGRWYYESVDIAPYLRQGQNVISARVLRYSNMHPGSLSFSRGPYPGLLVHCNIENVKLHTGTDGWEARMDEAVQMISRNEWNYALGPPFLALNERIHADLTEANWHTSVSPKWQPACVMSSKSMMLPVLEPWKLRERPIPQLTEVEKNFDGVVTCDGSTSLMAWHSFIRGSPLEIPPHQIVQVDLESNSLTTGFLKLAFLARSNTYVRVLCAEAYETPMARSGPGAKRQKLDRHDHLNGTLYGQSDYYEARMGMNVFEPFWFRAFRFVQLEITTTDEPVTMLSFTFRETHYPLEVATTVTTSTELDQMWTISLNTLRNCMHETYEDCPYYEQNQFIMDSRLQMLLTYQLSRDDRLARKTIHEFHSSRREDGLLEAQFPSPGRCVNIPQFSLFFIFMIHDHMRYFGDQRLLKEYLGTIDGIVNHFDSRLDTHGLVGQFDNEMWPFVDWVKEWHGTTGLHSMGIPRAYWNGAATYNSLIYALALQHAADICDHVRRYDTANEYRSRATALNAAVNKFCFHENMYTDGIKSQERSQHSQIFAILSGAISGPAAAELMRKTLRDASLPQCSYAMSFYVLRAAEVAGVYEELFPILIEPWTKLMSYNLTTWPEDNVMHRSDCHGWSSSPIYEIVTQLFGVQTFASVASKLALKPNLALLPDEACGSFTTRYGDIRLRWARTSGLFAEAKSDVDVVLELHGIQKTFHLTAFEELQIGEGTSSPMLEEEANLMHANTANVVDSPSALPLTKDIVKVT